MPGAKLASIVATVKQISCLAIRYMTRCKLSIVQNHHLLVCISGRGASIKRKLITGSTPRARPRKKKKKKARKQESKRGCDDHEVHECSILAFFPLSCGGPVCLADRPSAGQFRWSFEIGKKSGSHLG